MENVFPGWDFFPAFDALSGDRPGGEVKGVGSGKPMDSVLGLAVLSAKDMRF